MQPIAPPVCQSRGVQGAAEAVGAVGPSRILAGQTRAVVTHRSHSPNKHRLLVGKRKRPAGARE